MTATQKTGPWISVSRAEHSQPVNSTSLAKHPQLLREQNWEMHHLFLFHPVHPVDPRFSYLQKSDERIQLFKKRRALGRTPKTPSKTGWSHLKIGMIQTETWDLPTSRDFFTRSHPIAKDGRPLEGTCACASPRHGSKMQTHLDPHMKWLEEVLYEFVLWLFSSNFFGISLL